MKIIQSSAYSPAKRALQQNTLDLKESVDQLANALELTSSDGHERWVHAPHPITKSRLHRRCHCSIQ